MASSMFSQRTVFIAVLTLSIFAISAAARPCKTLFISSYSFSLRRLPSASSSSGYVTVVTEISRLRPVRLDDEVFIHRHVDAAEDEKRTETAPLFPVIGTASSASSFYDLGSLRDRTRDILSVVVSLLFGVGCGALTSATMYLAWSLFAGRCDGGSSEAGSDYDFDDASPKKMGYVKIPEVAAADSTVKEAVAV